MCNIEYRIDFHAACVEIVILTLDQHKDTYRAYLLYTYICQSSCTQAMHL